MKVTARSTFNIGPLAAALLLTTLLVLCYAGTVDADQPETTLYNDIFKLDRNNFTSKVLKRSDAWIVIVKKSGEELGKDWLQVAEELRGLSWVGTLDPIEELDILEAMNKDKIPPCMVFPFGNTTFKAEHMMVVDNAADAKKLVLAGTPDIVYKVTKEAIQDFYVSAYMSKPSKFPTMYLTNEKETPIFLKALSLRFVNYFQIGIFKNPTPTDLEALGFKNTDSLPVPALFTLVTSPVKVKGERPSTSAAMYDIDAMGYMNYIRLAKFFFVTNSKNRINLLGDSQAQDKDVVAMSDIIEIEKERFSQKLPVTNKMEL